MSHSDLLSADKVMQEAFLLAKKDVAAGYGHHFLPRTQPDSVPLTAERCVSFGGKRSRFLRQALTFAALTVMGYR